MPKNSVVASLVGNFSPVKSSKAILVRRMRHFRGEIGDVLKTRATKQKGQYEMVVRMGGLSLAVLDVGLGEC